ncbi:hypothetical protein NQ317_004536 [Molorchus minor]|uniref:C2H2-type domain-containing protein n=1 Tax=Molorchus minor TaxID=1323400 RepID=A0ABQ9JIE6_9CUCU|nr:hypothetical protein NQ317_004536 [Molorchus minor]
MEDGTEIITLNFAASGEQADSSNDPLEQPLDDATSGYEEEVRDEEEGARATDEEYMSSLEDEQHINPVFKVNQTAFRVRTASAPFPLKQLLDLHLPIHSRERNYKCDECNRKFFSKNDLQKHYQTHTGQKPHNCVVCQKSFSRYSLLRRHEKIHNDVPKYVCTQCDKTFLTKHYLDTHVEKHKKKRPYTCNVCNKSFVFKQGLERHEIVHSDNKPHKCNYCEVSFTSAIKLTRHLTSHAGLRPYPCKMCGRTFLLSHHLTRHMRSHYAAHTSTPEAIFGQHKCDICSMSFRRKDSLINHSAIHSMMRHMQHGVRQRQDGKGAHNHTSNRPALPLREVRLQLQNLGAIGGARTKNTPKWSMRNRSNRRSSPRLDCSRSRLKRSPRGRNHRIHDIQHVNVVPKHPPARIADFLKDELSSDAEDTPAAAETPQEDQPQEPPEESIEPIKPIVRQEGTRVYQRKAPISRKLPTIVQNPKNVAPLEHLTQLEQLTPETINTMPTKNAVDMKLGDKVVRVKKFIVTKEEMKAMAKQGILEMKGGQVVLKSPGQPILNATLKPVQKVDIENLLDQKAQSRQQVKKYQRKSTPLAAAADENSKHNEEPPEVDMNTIKS